MKGDFNRDGWIDIAGIQWGGQRIFVFLNAGNGTFLPAAFYNPSNGGLWGLVAGDLDNDSDLDLITANRQNGAFSVFLGTGTGSFSLLSTRSVGWQPSDVNLGDFNKDGRLDLVITDFAASSIRVAFGAGNGTFGTLQSYATGLGANYVATADLNSDTNLDLVVANQEADTITVLLGSANGAFSVGPTYPTGDYPVSVAIGDIDRDGDLDLAVGNNAAATASVFVGAGNGTFVLGTTLAAVSVRTIVFEDLNRDGALDIVVGNGISTTVPGSISVNLGNGDGSFQPYQSWTAGVNPGSLVVADVNNDGVFDVATANYSNRNGNDVSILIGRAVAVPSSTPTATSTATTTPTATSTATTTPTATSTATTTPTATNAPTVAPTASATTPPAGTHRVVFLPQVVSGRPQLLVAINSAVIPTRPALQTGEVYYTTTFTLTSPLPTGGHFYLSSVPDRIAPVTVDDELVVLLHGEEIYTRFLTYPREVELSRSLLGSWVDQPVTVIFRDSYGAIIGSQPVWLIWLP